MSSLLDYINPLNAIYSATSYVSSFVWSAKQEEALRNVIKHTPEEMQAAKDHLVGEKVVRLGDHIEHIYDEPTFEYDPLSVNVTHVVTITDDERKAIRNSLQPRGFMFSADQLKDRMTKLNHVEPVTRVPVESQEYADNSFASHFLRLQKLHQLASAENSDDDEFD